MTKLAIALAATLVAASPAVAKDRKPADPDKKVCHSDAPTGSRFPVRVCHTLAEWASIDGANASAARTVLDRTTQAGMATSASATAR